MLATSPPLQLAIAAVPDPVEDGYPLTFTLTVSNPGAVARNNVVVSLPTPALMYVSDSNTDPSGGCVPASACSPVEPLSWSLGTMAPGAVRVIRFSDASVSTVAMQGSLITAQATLRADGIGDLQQQHTVVVSEDTPPLQLAMSAERSRVAPGGLLTYRLRYSNLSATFAGDDLRARVPAGTSFVSASGGGVLVGAEVRWSLTDSVQTDGIREFTVQAGVA